MENIDNIAYFVMLLILVSAVILNSEYMGGLALVFSALVVFKNIFNFSGDFKFKNYHKALFIYFLIVTVSLLASTLFSLSLHGYIKTFIYTLFFFSASLFFKDNKNKIFPTIFITAILMSFESDFGTHLNDNYEIVSDENARAKILSTFYSIPNQLAKDNQKFQYSTISKNAKARDYKSSVEWLENYGLISRCYNLTLPEIPFEFFKIEDSFKVFLNDTGLYIAMLEDNIPDLIINGKLKIAKGAIYENIVAETFSKLGRKLYYYRKDSGLEIDFITEFNRQPVLVEVKAKNGHTKSAKEILENKVKYNINTLIKLTANNIFGNQTVLNFPYYLTLFLFKRAD